MDWGLQNRLSRFISPKTGHTVMLAVDHGYFLGPTSMLERPGETITPLIPYADTIMLTRGVLRRCIDPCQEVPVVLRVSGGTSIVGGQLSNEGIMTCMDDAFRLNACGVALSIFVGTPHERVTLLNMSKLVDEGEERGMPVVAVTAVGKELGKRDARFLGLCCRIAAELGVHLVKTYYCDDFEKVVDGCPAPIVVAGGPKIPEKEALELTYKAIQGGAIGVDMGRNIWQSDNPIGMIKAVRAIVHDGANIREAITVLGSSQKGRSAKKSSKKKKK
ncbi:MAG TPA: 3-hydroxy-5-phosphonooxypentane-2,4-dione thiolase [Euryarchaeota archaeon]|nr:3-hydroxy-5-phosphonooxypentane-2,4-dione thiolase [Euryarchaeota archaeon]